MIHHLLGIGKMMDDRARLIAATLGVTLSVLSVFGCAREVIQYRPIPAYLIPAAPDLPKIPAAELECLSDETYLKLATRDRLLRLQADELRALLEPKP